MHVLAAVKESYRRLVSKKRHINYKASAAILLLVFATGITVYGSYVSQSMANWAERSALLNTLLLCDTVIFATFMLIATTAWYISSMAYGSRGFRGLFSSGTFLVLFITTALPIVIASCSLCFKPDFLKDQDVVLTTALTLMNVVLLAPFVYRMLSYLRPKGLVDAYLNKIMSEHYSSGITGSIEEIAMLRPVSAGSVPDMVRLLERLMDSGDNEPVRYAIESIKERTMTALRDSSDDSRTVALACTWVKIIVDIGAYGARSGITGVYMHAIGHMTEICLNIGNKGVSSLAYRGIGKIYSTGMPAGRFPQLGTKTVRSYLSIYDRTGRQEPLDEAISIVEAYLESTKSGEERPEMLFLKGGAYRRLAEITGNETNAITAISVLSEALDVRNMDASPIDHALIMAETGRAHMALGRIKYPIKSYKTAAGSFIEAGRVLTPLISRWDSAILFGEAGYAYTMLADEYLRVKKYDEALNAARSALASYSEASKFFAPGRSADEHSRVMSNQGLAHTIVSEVYLKSRMLDEALKHTSLALESYRSASSVIDPATMPEAMASLKTSMGMAYVTYAEICFREKKYESAITACDNAIAAYNDAVRIYESSGKDKMAAGVKKHLKQANDLFSTMMRIGSSISAGTEAVL